MPGAPVIPRKLRLGYLRHDLTEGLRRRRPRTVARGLAAFVSPTRWPVSEATRMRVADAVLRSGDTATIDAVLADMASWRDASRPGTGAAIRRAAALEMVIDRLPDDRQRVERAVIAYLRGQLAARRSSAPEGSPGDTAATLAGALRSAGHARPIVVATFPGFDPNPYGALMEQAYEAHGLAAVHLGQPAGVEAIVAGQDAGGYRTVVHLNAPDRFVESVRSVDDAVALAASTLASIDGWRTRGATLVASIHNGPRLSGPRGAAERAIAQGIVDRADVIHILTVSTPRLLDGWIEIDTERAVHIPHPNYDGVYGPPLDRDSARARLGIEAAEGPAVVLGLVGSLADRKGALGLLDAFALARTAAPDGGRLRLLLAGAPIGGGAEELIRRSLTEPGIIARIGYVADTEIPEILAAIDVAVIPYDQLNSGWLHLALSAGIPAIAPDGTTAEEIVDRAALVTYDPSDPRSLTGALAEAARLASPAARAAARRSVADLDARRLSERFVEAVLAAVRARPDERSATERG